MSGSSGESCTSSDDPDRPDEEEEEEKDGCCQVERRHIEPVFSSFLCPLTNEVMRDPVIIENGNTFERKAISKWFDECKKSGRKPSCPLTFKELKTTRFNPSIALRRAIKEWEARNEAAQLHLARTSLSCATSETHIHRALNYIRSVSKGSGSNKHDVHNPEIVRLVVGMLRNSSTNVRSKALKTLRGIAEQESDIKEVMTEGATIRTIVKFLSPERSTEREKKEAISLLYELSKSQNLCEKIGSEHGAILILVSMSGSESEKSRNVDKADKTLNNLAQSEKNVRQMAESGRLEPLLTLLLKGSPETKRSMATFLGDLVLNNDVKVCVANTVGSSLVNLMTSCDKESREASLRALNQISSCDESAKVLIQAGILPPLVKDLFMVGREQLPTRLKEVSATILSDLVNSGYDISSVIIGPNKETLVSVEIIHNLLRLISNTGPSIESKLLQVLVGLTSYPETASSVVAAIKSSGLTTVSLVELINEQDRCSSAVKLLHNLSPYMAQELSEALIASGQLGRLLDIIMGNSGIAEEQAAAVGLLAELPETDVALTREMLKRGSFEEMMCRVKEIRRCDIRGGRFMTHYLDGLVRSLARVTYVLAEVPEAVEFCRAQNLAGQFVELLQTNGPDNVHIASAWALQKLSAEASKLTAAPHGVYASMFTCFGRPHDRTRLCRVHGGVCSLNATFCLVDRRARAIEKLVTLLDHENDRVAEASLAALSTLVDDGTDIEEGVMTLHMLNATKPIVEILVEKRSENLRKRGVWVVERFLRNDRISCEIPNEQNVVSALVDAFNHGDNRTRQIAEHALRHVDRLPNFSEVFRSGEVHSIV